MSSRGDIARHLYNRALIVNREHHGEPEQIAIAKLAKAAADSKNKLHIDKLASIVEKYDMHYGLCRFYGKDFPSPEEIAHYTVSVKSASEVRNSIVSLTSGKSYPKSALKKAGIAPYRALGPDFVNAISEDLDSVDIEKLASILPTLPLDDAKILDRAFTAVGVSDVDSINS